jgi:hypothetical protein
VLTEELVLPAETGAANERIRAHAPLINDNRDADNNQRGSHQKPLGNKHLGEFYSAGEPLIKKAPNFQLDRLDLTCVSCITQAGVGSKVSTPYRRCFL